MRADVIHIAKTDEYFRLLYDSKGRFVTHRITAEEGKVRSNLADGILQCTGGIISC